MVPFTSGKCTADVILNQTSWQDYHYHKFTLKLKPQLETKDNQIKRHDRKQRQHKKNKEIYIKLYINYLKYMLEA